MAKIASSVLFLVVIFGADTASAARDCGRQVHFVNGVTKTRDISLAPGQRCSYSLTGSLGPMAGIRIIQKPAHGQAIVKGHRVSYVAPRGYLGPDTFIYERYGLDNRNNPMHAPVRVMVSIEK
ncbi:MAG: hypothetical protein QOD40_505 [Alphaproteobacteria bacterium]|jgi:hypothetical protein|nr:hypothetical protein [Alphaproteobacteria bacterium]MEA2991585.1 hypothetical protein [Alphaproteobacteria bacterium]